MKKIVLFFFILSSLSVFSQNCVATYAGNGLPNLINGDIDIAQFNNPSGICRDRFGNIFIADGANQVIRKIDALGIVSTYAGTGIMGFRDGPNDSAQFNTPFDLCADDSGNIYVSDFENQRIRIVWTTTGNLYIADSWNHRIRKINLATSIVSTFAGGGSAAGVGSTGSWTDGGDTSARFYTPCGLSLDNKNNIYVADAYNHRIRIIDTTGYVRTLAGMGTAGYVDGPDWFAEFNTPTEVCWTPKSGLLIGDTYNNCIRLLDTLHSVYTLVGNGLAGYKDTCVSNLTQFNHPRGMISNANEDSILIVDGSNHTIRLLYEKRIPSNINPTSEKPIQIEQSGDLILVQFPAVIDAPIQMNIFDICGSMINTRTYPLSSESNSNKTFNIASLSAGIYELSIIYKGALKTFKITKQ